MTVTRRFKNSEIFEDDKSICGEHVNHMFPSTSPESYTLRITSLRLANTQIKMDTLVSVLKKKYLEFRTLRECSSDKRW